MEDGSATSSATLFRAFAAALGKLRRSPGKDETWVEGVLRIVERDHPERFNRMRRRLGLVQRLGGLAQLRVEEEALATVGLFCYELIGERLPTAAPAGPWLDYLYRNERWLGPCLHVCESMYAATWEEIDSRPALIARFVAAYDKQTLEEHERPLQVIQALVESAQTEDGDRLGPLVWSEDGQELCDFHFRRHGDYPLDAKNVKRNLELLKRVLPAPATAPLASRPGPVRTPITAVASEHTRKAHGEEPPPVQASANFERRRQALRSTQAEVRDAGEHGTPGEAVATVEEDEQDVDTVPSAMIVAEPEPAPPAIEPEEPEPRRATRPEPPQPQQEEFCMDRSQITALPSMDGESINVTRRIETVRAQLDQIRRLAIDTQEMLADLAPQVEELATWVAELESVLNRRTTTRRAA
jgi:hypothetical protein